MPAIVVLATVAALVVGEFGVRLLGLGPPARGESKSLRVVCRNVGQELAPGVGRALVPGAEERHTYPLADGTEREIVYRINLLGWRGPELERAKPEGVLRICALGDSFTFGTAIQYEDTWPARLQSALGELGGESPYQVLNCGIEAINLPQEVALLENRVARLDPDLVVLCVYLNDASGVGIESPPPSERSERTRVWVERLGLTSGVWAEGEERTDAQRRTMALRRRSELVDWLCHQAYGRLYGPIAAENYRRDWSDGSPGQQAARRALERAKELSDLVGFELLVTMYPVLTGLDGDYPYRQEHERVRATCAALDVPFLDLAEVLAGEDAADLHAHPHDSHPNGRANGLVGDALAAWVVERR